MTTYLCALTPVVLLIPRLAIAADRRFKIKSPHFTLWSSSDNRDARMLVWQLEQIRGAMAAVRRC